MQCEWCTNVTPYGLCSKICRVDAIYLTKERERESCAYAPAHVTCTNTTPGGTLPARQWPHISHALSLSSLALSVAS